MEILEIYQELNGGHGTNPLLQETIVHRSSSHRSPSPIITVDISTDEMNIVNRSSRATTMSTNPPHFTNGHGNHGNHQNGHQNSTVNSFRGFQFPQTRYLLIR